MILIFQPQMAKMHTDYLNTNLQLGEANYLRHSLKKIYG